MLPDISIRINNLIKAMEKTIAPAIDPDNGLAKEQAALVVSHLRMLDQQWDTAYLYEKGSYENMRALSAHLVSLAEKYEPGKSTTLELSETLGTMPDELPLTVSGISTLTANLGTIVDRVITDCFRSGSETFKTALTNIVLDYNAKQSARERIWFGANKLDPDITDLSTMEEMLFTNVYKFTAHTT